jgi:poly(A) polymerase
MLQRSILKPVLPEIEPERLCDLEALISAEREAGVAPEALRRLAALLPREPQLADAIGVRLRLSNKARKRLACAADPGVAGTAQALAYRIGTDCATDRLLLAGKADEARSLAGWKAPRLPIGGGDLIARGLTQGPAVARTLRKIEDAWADEGFPEGDALEAIVSKALASAA